MNTLYQTILPKRRSRRWVEYPNIFLNCDFVNISGCCGFCYDNVNSDDFYSKGLNDWETKLHFKDHEKTKLCMKCLNRVYANKENHDISHEYDDDEDNQLMKLYYVATECFCDTCAGDWPDHWLELKGRYE